MKTKISLPFSVVFEKSDMTGDMNKDTLETRIAGPSYYVDFDYFTEYSVEGGYVEAEPNNKYDPNAIAIYHDSGKCVGHIAKECISKVKEFTDGETAPCLIYIAPCMGRNGEKRLKGVVRIFRCFEGESEYVSKMLEHFIVVYTLRLDDEMKKFQAKLEEIDKIQSLSNFSKDDRSDVADSDSDADDPTADDAFDDENDDLTDDDAFDDEDDDLTDDDAFDDEDDDLTDDDAFDDEDDDLTDDDDSDDDDDNSDDDSAMMLMMMTMMK